MKFQSVYESDGPILSFKRQIQGILTLSGYPQMHIAPVSFPGRLNGMSYLLRSVGPNPFIGFVMRLPENWLRFVGQWAGPVPTPRIQQIAASLKAASDLVQPSSGVLAPARGLPFVSVKRAQASQRPGIEQSIQLGR